MCSVQEDFDIYADLFDEAMRPVQSANRSLKSKIKTDQSNDSSVAAISAVSVSTPRKRKENDPPESDEKRRKSNPTTTITTSFQSSSSVLKDKTQSLNQVQGPAQKKNGNASEASFDPSVKEKYVKLLDKCKQLQQFGLAQMKRNQELERKNAIALNNISSLYKTAKAEIERKDESITKLRERLDQLLFRRKSVTNHPQPQQSHHRQDDTGLHRR